ncbi:MAG: FAD/NAD(P)-binding oxidoreductase [Hyphomicrobiaceae bacterium]
MTRVLIVGAGPAGIRAAETMVEAGLRPIVVDEGHRAGGQIYRRPPDGFARTQETLYGSQAGKARVLHELFDGLVAAGRIDYRPRTSVVALSEEAADCLCDGRIRRIGYERLIIATGAMDRIMPVSGGERAGVFTIGAVQIMLKAQAVAPGRRIVLAGTGPLLSLVADQLRRAGAGLAAVLDTAPLTAQIGALPAMLASRPGTTLRGLRIRAALGRLYHPGVRVDEIVHEVAGPVAVRWRDARDRSRTSPCDAVGIGWHLMAETRLAELAGARMAWSDPQGQWLPVIDAMGRAGAGLYVAGDCAHIAGADAAEIGGRLAASACLADLGFKAADPRADLSRLAWLRRFAAAMAQAFPWPPIEGGEIAGDTVLCRCEGVTAAQLRDAADVATGDFNRAKSLSRLGMGRCQGRYCSLAGALVVAARAGQKPGDVGHLRAQPPVRPVPAAAWLGAGEEDRPDS